jgi:hypothetical protein
MAGECEREEKRSTFNLEPPKAEHQNFPPSGNADLGFHLARSGLLGGRLPFNIAA